MSKKETPLPVEAVRVQRLDDGGLALLAGGGSCGYVDAIAVDALRAFLRPEPSEDERGALAQLLFETYQDAAGMATVGTSWLHEFSQHYAGVLLAAGFTRRPMPSRETVARLLATQSGEEWDRLVGTASVARNRFLRKADAVLALFKGGER